MSKKRFNKKIATIIASLLLVSTIGVLSYMVTWNSSYPYPVEKVSPTLISKIQKTSLTGTKLELSNKDLNAIMGTYIQQDKTFGNIKVKGIYSDILDNSIKLNIPINYKGFNFMVSSEGKLYVQDKDIVYNPVYFKIGKANLPKAFVLDKLKKYLVKGTSIKDKSIVINKGILPLGIKSIESKNNNLYVSLEKPAVNMEKKLVSLYRDFNSKLLIQDNRKEDTNNNITLNNSSNDNSKNSNNSNNTSSNVDNSKDKITDTQSSAKREQALNRISGGLSAAMSSVSTGSQKAVIGQMMSVVNTMQGNPSYNPNSASGSIKASYKSLSDKEKLELKSAVFSNVDGNSVNIVMSMFGM